MARRVPAWTERPLCECGDRARLSTYEGRRLFHCPALWPDLEVIFVNCNNYTWTLPHKYHVLCLWQPCEFEEFVDNNPQPNYEGPLYQLESDVEYNMQHQEHERMQRERRITIQQLVEREIGVKMREDDLMRRRVARMMSRVGRERGRGRGTGSSN